MEHPPNAQLVRRVTGSPQWEREEEEEDEKKEKTGEQRARLLASQMRVCADLNDALSWCEDSLISSLAPVPDGEGINSAYHSSSSSSSSSREEEEELSANQEAKRTEDDQSRRMVSRHLRQIHALRPPDCSSESLDALMSYFTRCELTAGQVLWRQGEKSSSAVLLQSGRLLNTLEEEAGTTEEIYVGWSPNVDTSSTAAIMYPTRV